MLKAHTTALLCVVALLPAACGGDGKSESKKDDGPTTAQTPTPTATPTATPKATATPKPVTNKTDGVKGIDVAKVGAARDRFVALCAKRQKDKSARNDKSDLTELRKATSTFIRAFKANPDKKWRRTSGVPKISMRERLVALGTIARTACGGGDALDLGARMSNTLLRS